MMEKAVGSLVQTWNRGSYPNSTVDAGCYSDDDSDDDCVISEKEEVPFPWDDWDTFCGRAGSAWCVTFSILFDAEWKS